MSLGQWGYVAAFLDGEGSALLVKRNCRHGGTSIRIEPRIVFNNTYHEALTVIKGIIDCGWICQEKRPKYRRQACYSLVVTNFRDIIHIIEKCFAFLVIKKKHAQLMKEFCEIRLKKMENGTTHGHPRGISSFGKRELEIYEEIKELNRRYYLPNGKKVECK
jgi:hypothetical protein